MKITVCVVSCLIFSLIVSVGRSAPPSIESVWPPVGQRGTEFDVKIVGSGFEDSRELTFYSAELQCKNIRVDSEYELTATVVASENCRIGNEPFRVLGRDGYSDLRTLRVTPFPVIVPDLASTEGVSRSGGSRRSMGAGSASGFTGGAMSLSESTNVREISNSTEATLVPALNVTMCSVLKAGTIDRFVVQLNAGQRLTVEVEAVRLGKELLDTMLEIMSPSGEVMVHADDNPMFHQDPMASLIAPSSGQYVIQIHEANYDGGESSFYAVHIGDFPFPSVAYPAGGPLGVQMPIRFIGLDAAEQFTLDLPSDPGQLSTFQLFSPSATGPSPSAVPFRLSEFPNVVEVDSDKSNDSPNANVTATTAPVALNGILESSGDVDCFAIEAHESQSLRIEAFAGRIGSPVDSLLTIVDSSSQVVASNDDWGSHDSRLDFTPPSTGRYFVCVTDKLASGGPNHVYRVEVTPLQPSVTAFLPRPERTSQLAQTIAVPQGNRVLVRVGVRRELFDGDVEGAFGDLPTGVRASPFGIPSDRFWMPTVLSATADAPLQAALAQVSLIVRNDDLQVRGGFEQIVDLVAESADQLFTSATVRRLPVAVGAPLPFSVELERPTTPLPRNGSLVLRVHVKRDSGFEEPVRIELPFLPPWVVCDPSLVIPAGQSSGDYRLTATEQAQPRTWPLVATAQVNTVSASGDTSRIDGCEVASELIELAIAETPIVGEFQTLAAEQGESLQVHCQLKRTAQTPMRLTATLEGLPNRVGCESQIVRDSDQQVVFNVKFADDSPVGVFPSVQCRLVGEIDGQAVSFVVAPNSALQIAPKGKLFRGADGQPLSPLEALRRTQKE